MFKIGLQLNEVVSQYISGKEIPEILQLQTVSLWLYCSQEHGPLTEKNLILHNRRTRQKTFSSLRFLGQAFKQFSTIIPSPRAKRTQNMICQGKVPNGRAMQEGTWEVPRAAACGRTEVSGFLNSEVVVV